MPIDRIGVRPAPGPQTVIDERKTLSGRTHYANIFIGSLTVHDASHPSGSTEKQTIASVLRT